MERKIQKEREMEGGEFAHKESFVTSAYKKKLQERAEEEERERREAALEGEIQTEVIPHKKKKCTSVALYIAYSIVLWSLCEACDMGIQKGPDSRY